MDPDNTPSAAGTTFLQNPTTPRLQSAVAHNHLVWMAHMAQAAGGEVHRWEGMTRVYTPADGGQLALLFPRLASDRMGEKLDRILAEARDRFSLSQVACWSLVPTQPEDLGVQLAARGFEWGWQPHWMWLDFRYMHTDFPMPPGLRIEQVEEETNWDVEDLPYYSRELGRHLSIASQSSPGRIRHFAAWLDGRPVGHSVLCLTTGSLGVAGIYNCGVVPAARNRGVGKAVTLAACRYAQALGCPGAVLNATPMGEPMYRRLGFESFGHGQTWWMHRETLGLSPPSAEEVRLAEAVGRGDLEGLGGLARQISRQELDAPLRNGMTLVQLAVQAGQPASVAWLVQQGATLDVISGWDLGWRDQVEAALAQAPDLARQRLGRWRITPLHEAVYRDDLELVQLLLRANPDLTIQDDQFHSTPLGWAQHLGREEILDLLRRHQV